jgi:hypothetical protein
VILFGWGTCESYRTLCAGSVRRPANDLYRTLQLPDIKSTKIESDQVSGDDLTRLFEACLAREAVDPGRPQFAELWAAWLAFVGTPVGGPGVPDGEESVAFQTEPNEPEDDDLIADVKPGTRVFATRGWDGRGSLLQLTVIAVFDPVLTDEFG